MKLSKTLSLDGTKVYWHGVAHGFFRNIQIGSIASGTLRPVEGGAPWVNDLINNKVSAILTHPDYSKVRAMLIDAMGGNMHV